MESWKSPHGRKLPLPGARTLLMGVLNVTPDSFSDGGQFSSMEHIVQRAAALIEGGADVIDLGGESTRPSALPISAEEELSRVLPVLHALRQRWPELPISIDTYKFEVADIAVREGADIVNDVWGLMHGVDLEDRSRWRTHAVAMTLPSAATIPAMAAVVARRGCPVIVMHNRPDRSYTDFVSDVVIDLQMSLLAARMAGIEPGQLWLDPGFGFAKNVPQNLEVLRQLHRICALGHPVLVGTSRKSTIGAVLGSDVSNRVDGGGATVVWSIQQGCSMIRVHDIREMARFARMADAIKAGLNYRSG
ncbi:MAG: dihydropteroate synthase [Opitutus sp.]